MENPKEIIKELIEKNQKKKEEKHLIKQQKKREAYLNKPRYKIEDLCIGKIIYIQSERFYSGSSIFDSGRCIRFQNIKKFAIFYQDTYSDYLHIISNHKFNTSMSAEPGEYCVHYDSIKNFDKAFQRFMIKNGLNRNSMLSIKQITEIENGINDQLYPDQCKDELFWGN